MKHTPQLPQILDGLQALMQELQKSILFGGETYHLDDVVVKSLTQNHPIWQNPPPGWGKKKIATFLKGDIASRDAFASSIVDRLQEIFNASPSVRDI